MKKVISSIWIIGSLIPVLLGCNRKPEKLNEGTIVISSGDSIHSIVLQKNDSVTVRINLDDSLNLSSIIGYNKNVIEGNALTFYKGERLKEKRNHYNGILNGHSHSFYESGALMSDVFYQQSKPAFYSWDYWDDIYSLTKYVRQYDSNGNQISIKVFDIKGNFLRDSILQ
jgi:antitoxin component YwqK of YwqJK toxin-antitoxin module